MSKAYFNKPLYEVCRNRGMSHDDAHELACLAPIADNVDENADGDEDEEEEEEEHEDAVDGTAKKALDAAADAIRKGSNLYTQDDVDAIKAEYEDVNDRLVKSFDVAVSKLRERVKGMETAFLALHDQNEQTTTALNRVTAVSESLERELVFLREARLDLVGCIASAVRDYSRDESVTTSAPKTEKVGRQGRYSSPGHAFRVVRLHLGWTQFEAAMAIGEQQGKISQFENDRRSLPAANRILKHIEMVSDPSIRQAASVIAAAYP